MTPSSHQSRPAIDTVAFNGWKNNLRLSNGTVELIATLDVGPRILAYQKIGGPNPFKVFEDQSGTVGEQIWRSRGGHRLWIAPEDKVRSYYPDNAPVAWEKLGDLHVRLTPAPESSNGIQKQIDLKLDPHGTGVTVVHRLMCIGPVHGPIAPWCLSVMAAGGVAIVPQPELGQHPRDLLPDRKFVLWPYTDMSDARWHFGRKHLCLKQDTACGPTKIGLAHTLGWSGYLVNGVFFLKHYPWDPAASYPDFGCNLEIFSNARMLELESIGPVTALQPKQVVEHVEHWQLHDGPMSLDVKAESQIDDFLKPILEKANQPTKR